MFQFDLEVWPSERVWASLREIAGQRPLVAVPFHKVLALGTLADIQDAFGDNLKGPIERSPIVPRDFLHEDGAVVSLMRQALVRSIAHSAGLQTDGLRVLWRSSAVRRFHHGSHSYFVHEAAEIFLRRIGGVQHMVLMPSLRVFDQSGAEPSPDVANPIKLRILGYQHNKPFNQAVNGWRKTLFPGGKVAVFE